MTPSTAPTRRNNDYAELRAIIKERGLLDRSPSYFVLKVVSTLAMLVVSVLVIVLVDNLWLQLANAVFLAFIFTQIGLLSHDVGHRQIMTDGRQADRIGLVLNNLLLGLSRQWWVDYHNLHHSHPNEADTDPDIDIPILAFSEEDARAKRGGARWLVRYQVVTLFVIFFIMAYVWRIKSIGYVLFNRPRQPVAEWLCLLAHHVIYTVGLILALGLWPALVFMGVHLSLTGLYMGLIFAPNHKGMPLWESDQPPDFLRQQVLTARNVHSHPVTDFWYGGLNYQIEHHLFPTMPRNNLHAAQQIVRDFCTERGVSYHETSVLESYREILTFLHQVSAPLRARA